MIIVDAHEDIAYNALVFKRDYRLAAHETREREASGDHPNGIATTGLPDGLRGRVAVVFATVFTAPGGNPLMSGGDMTYQTPKEAHKLGMDQIDYYYRLTDSTHRVFLIQTQADLDETLATWADDQPNAERRQGFILLMENADPIREPKAFEEWYARGVRIVGPAWTASRYCGGTGAPGGLTTLGRELLDVMADFNAVLDLSHMAEQAFFEALDQYEGQIIASHSNPRRFRSSDRHLSDTMIRRLAERDGVMGIVMYNAFLSDDWRQGDQKHKLPFSTVIDAIDYVCQLTGSAAHVGIGTDFDGGFGSESIPDGIDTVADLWNLNAALRERGYSDADIEAILGGNMLRKVRPALPAK